MVIAAHIHSQLLAVSQLFQSLKFLAQHHPHIQLVIFINDPLIKESAISINGSSEGEHEPSPSNIQFKKIRLPLTSNLRIHFWYNYKLPSILKKIEADIFISEVGICSLKSQIPQWLWITNTSFLDKKAIRRFPTDGYMRKYFPRFLKICAGVMVREEYMTSQVLEKYDAPANKFHFAGEYLYDIFKPVEWEAKNELLETFSSGIEYFYCDCNTVTRTNITVLLKAFSLFKKRLKSGFKLVLHLYDVSLEDCVKDFHLYKYRNDVIVEHSRASAYQPAQLIASAYAAIFLPSEIRGHDDGLNALVCAVPLIITDKPEYHSLYKEAVLFSYLDEKSIADNMILLYKDESLRNSYIQKGLELMKTYTLPAVANRLWQTISKL